MSRVSSVMNGRHRPKTSPRQSVGQFTLLLVVLISHLLYGAVASAGSDGPVPIVEVKLTEFTIEMPPTVPVGPVTFSVTNAGTVEHNFEVENHGLEEKFDVALKPDENRHLRVDLPAGTYTIYCPVDDHKERGMRLELKVAQQRAE